MTTETSNRAVKRKNIIYVRGFALSVAERDDNAADSYCGCNVGSSVYRAVPNKERPRTYMFESSVVRLANEYGYNVIYQDGLSVMDPAFTTGEDGVKNVANGITMESIVIRRFYDTKFDLLGDGSLAAFMSTRKNLPR